MKREDGQQPEAAEKKRDLQVSLPAESQVMVRRIAQSTKLTIAKLQAVIEGHPDFKRAVNDILREAYKKYQSENDLFKEVNDANA